MNLKKIGEIIVVYGGILLFFTLLYTLSFHTSLFSNQNVLFYRGIRLLVTVTIVFLILIKLLKKILSVNWETLIAAVLVAASLNLSFFILFPVSIERSISVYILNTLKNAPSQNNCQGYNKEDLERKIIDEYIVKNKALQKRMIEQSQIDFVRNNNSCLSLSEKGKNFISTSELIKKWYGIK